MDELDIGRFVFAFLFVIALIGGLGVFLKRYTKFQAMLGVKEEGARLAVIEVRYLDPKRKLLLVRRDDREHLLLLADGRELVIETNINRA